MPEDRPEIVDGNENAADPSQANEFAHRARQRSNFPIDG